MSGAVVAVSYAMMYVGNADIAGIYESRDAALADLAAIVDGQPELRDALGLCPFEDGRPAGAFRSAGELLGSRLAQQQLDIGPTPVS